VLANMAVRTWPVGRLAPGMHRIDVLTDGAPDDYGMPPSD